jgi:hypothetical protein
MPHSSHTHKLTYVQPFFEFLYRKQDCLCSAGMSTGPSLFDIHFGALFSLVHIPYGRVHLSNPRQATYCCIQHADHQTIQTQAYSIPGSKFLDGLCCTASSIKDGPARRQSTTHSGAKTLKQKRLDPNYNHINIIIVMTMMKVIITKLAVTSIAKVTLGCCNDVDCPIHEV